jgi:ankyrin repeat protein
MKHLLLTTIAAVVLAGCGPSVHDAAYFGNIEGVKRHLAAGADVNAQDNRGGYTPLHYAARKGHKEVVELLIAEGAEVNANDDRGSTPLDNAIYAKETEIADLLRTHGGKTGEELDFSIHEAAEQGDIEAVKQHLAAGTDVDAKTGGGMTPLHLAAGYGRKEVAELLIAEGADVNVKDELGITPLDWANGKEIADLLRKHGGKTKKELEAAGK